MSETERLLTEILSELKILNSRMGGVEVDTKKRTAEAKAMMDNIMGMITRNPGGVDNA